MMQQLGEEQQTRSPAPNRLRIAVVAGDAVAAGGAVAVVVAAVAAALDQLCRSFGVGRGLYLYLCLARLCCLLFHDRDHEGLDLENAVDWKREPKLVVEEK